MPVTLVDARAGKVVLSDAIATTGYGPNLVANDKAQSGTNANWSQTAYDAVNQFGGFASFKVAAGTVEIDSDARMPIDPAQPFLVSYWAKATTFVPGSHAYFGLKPYDVDNLLIASQHVMWFPNTLTTLAADLHPGDTTVTLTSAANWINTGTFQSAIIVWDYVDGHGKTWPAQTYSRHALLTAWNAGGIVGNVITLKVPWVGFGSIISAGTAVSNGNAGSSYSYCCGANIVVPNAWTQYQAIVPPGYDTSGAANDSKWRQGVTQVQMLMLLNRDTVGNVTNVTGIQLAQSFTGGKVALVDSRAGSVAITSALAD